MKKEDKNIIIDLVFNTPLLPIYLIGNITDNIKWNIAKGRYARRHDKAINSLHKLYKTMDDRLYVNDIATIAWLPEKADSIEEIEDAEFEIIE